MAKANKAAPAANPYSPEAMRKRFHALQASIASIESRTAPLRAKRDALQLEAEDVAARMKKIADEFNGIEKSEGLAEKKQELSTLVRALGGRTGNVDGTGAEAAAAQ